MGKPGPKPKASIRYCSARPHRKMTKEYSAFLNAKARCSCKPGSPNYEDYAGRGIRFLFDSFEQFYKELGPKPSPNMLLDRINNDGNYEPGNVQWATAGWSKTNQRMTTAKIDHCARIAFLGGIVSTHNRWHRDKGITKEGCRLCSTPKKV
jgi:hypothetical protein